MYLVHTIAYRQITNREENVEGASIKYSILQSVLGEDVYELIKYFRDHNCNDTFVIYTGYYPEEIESELAKLYIKE